MMMMMMEDMSIPAFHVPTVIRTAAIFWMIMFIFDRLCRGIFGDVYHALLSHYGITIGLGQIRLFSSRFNRVMMRFSNAMPRFWRVWFTFGVVFGVISMFTSVLLLCYSLWQSLFRYYNSTIMSSSTASTAGHVLTPVIPGVNLPGSHVMHYFLSLLISGVIHELGHALASVTDAVGLNGFGIFIMGIYPGAFVDLNAEQLSLSSSLRQMRIYCAGVWHNFILAVVAFLLMWNLTLLMMPLYHSGAGVTVLHVKRNSPLHGHIDVGARIVAINDDCPVNGIVDWRRCLSNLLQPIEKQAAGFCQDKAVVLAAKPQSIKSQDQCCSIGNEANSTEPGSSTLCYNFKYMAGGTEDSSKPNNNENEEELLEDEERRVIDRFLGKVGAPQKNSRVPQYKRKTALVCLKARMTAMKPSCRNNNDCMTESSLLSNRVCVFPDVLRTENFSRLVKIYVLNTESVSSVPWAQDANSHFVLFVGDPRTLSYSLAVSSYSPRFQWLPLTLPTHLEIFFRYLIPLSAALALLNIVPAFLLDGQWAFRSFIEFTLHIKLTNVPSISRACDIVLWFGSILFGVNVALSLWELYKS